MTDFIVKMREETADADTSGNPPTHTELTRLFGDPSEFVNGWMGLVYSADHEEYYLCVVLDSTWIVFQGALAE